MTITGPRLRQAAREAAEELRGTSSGRPFVDKLDVYKVAGKVFLIVTDDPDDPIIIPDVQDATGRNSPMTLTDANDLLVAVGNETIRSAPTGWTSITLELIGTGSATKSRAAAQVAGATEHFHLSNHGVKAGGTLRAAMYQEGTGTWYRATFTIDSTGELEADFDYDAKPYDPMHEGQDYIADLLLEDQKVYLRDQEHLPDWHPAKTR